MKLVLENSFNPTWMQENMDLNFIIPSNKKSLLEVAFLDSDVLNYFDPSQCLFETIEYRFSNTHYDFDQVYSLFVEKDVTKEID